MKKLIFAIILLAGLAASAQTEHLTFKGVPIDGNLNSFVSKLKQKGFSLLHSESGTAVLNGDFAAYKNCMVGVYEHESGIVNRIAVMFPNKDTWARLYGDYSNLKEMLTEKYGEPTSIEEFEQMSYDMNDNSKMHEVRMGRCRYISDWETNNGTIELRIDHQLSIGCMVILIYADAENDAKVRSKAIDDL